MVLDVVQYGHPVLRRKGARIEAITADIRQLIRDMLETMEAAHGVGLAAQQVGHALQLTVVDVAAVPDRPSTLEIEGRSVAIKDAMPIVLVNPVLQLSGPSDTGPEGCLSFPEVYADITRPNEVTVSALNERGETVSFHTTGFLGRAIQHEVDHLNGILFIDRMDRETRNRLREEIEEIQARTKAGLKTSAT